MKSLYTVLIAIVALFVFASLAVAKPPFWDDQVNKPSRFKVLSEFSGAAVFDKETGLVWDQSPATTTHTWNPARFQCTGRTVGGRKGWRLPSVHELASLVELNNPGRNPEVRPGHPFENVQSSVYWSATTAATNTGFALVVVFSDGLVSANEKDNVNFVWCVRGGMNADAY
jgi:hypothetical protein